MMDTQTLEKDTLKNLSRFRTHGVDCEIMEDDYVVAPVHALCPYGSLLQFLQVLAS